MTAVVDRHGIKVENNRLALAGIDLDLGVRSAAVEGVGAGLRDLEYDRTREGNISKLIVAAVREGKACRRGPQHRGDSLGGGRLSGSLASGIRRSGGLFGRSCAVVFGAAFWALRCLGALGRIRAFHCGGAVLLARFPGGRRLLERRRVLLRQRQGLGRRETQHQGKGQGGSHGPCRHAPCTGGVAWGRLEFLHDATPFLEELGWQPKAAGNVRFYLVRKGTGGLGEGHRPKV